MLTVLAVYLAIHYRDALTVNIALALGLCVVMGGLLPLAVYGFDYLFAKNERLMEEARAPENLREALIRLEKLGVRVEDAAEGATKSTLVARQVPDRIEEKLKRLDEIADRLQPESLEKMTADIKELAERLESLSNASDHAKEPIHPRLAAAVPEDSAPPAPVSDDSESIVDDWVEEPTDADDISVPGQSEDEAFVPGASPLDEDPLTEEIEAETEDETEEPTEAPVAKKKKKKARAPAKSPKRAKKSPVQADEPSLFPSEEISETRGVGEGQCLLIVKAMVGISNKLHARGDAPLDWDKGVALEPAGIGEWRLALDGISEPVCCELRINDDVAALGEPLTLEPGQRQTVTPRFPPLS